MIQRDADAYRGILRSGSVVAGASIVNIGIGILRVKGIALLLGPVGVGIVGLLASIMTTAATLFGLGLVTSGVRQLASSGEDVERQHSVRLALLIANVVLGILGGSVVFVLRERISMLVFGDLSQTRNIAWLGLGVLLTMLAASQTALLQGLRRIRAMAAANVAGALLGTSAGLAALSYHGAPALVAVVVLLPAGMVAAGTLVTLRIERRPARITPAGLLPQWRDMATLGIAFMFTSLMGEATLLFVRSSIGHRLSLVDAGHFQAAWQVSMQYIGFVLTAMLAEYYPRLSAHIDDFERTNRAANAQIQVALLLGGPVMIAMMATASWLVALLYSGDFGPSVELLRWQVLGDVLKVASWPMGFILLAKAERGAFVLTQGLWYGTYALAIWLLLPALGLRAAGYAFLACYFVSFFLNLVVVNRMTGFRCRPSNLILIAILFAACSATMAFATVSGALAGLVAGAVLFLGYGMFAVARLAHLARMDEALPAWSRKLVERLSSRIGGALGD